MSSKPTSYAHLPLVLGPDGKKLGKRDGALPLETLDERRVVETLARTLRLLGHAPVAGSPREMLAAAVERFDPGRISAGPLQAAGAGAASGVAP